MCNINNNNIVTLIGGIIIVTLVLLCFNPINVKNKQYNKKSVTIIMKGTKVLTLGEGH